LVEMGWDDGWLFERVTVDIQLILGVSIPDD